MPKWWTMDASGVIVYMDNNQKNNIISRQQQPANGIDLWSILFWLMVSLTHFYTIFRLTRSRRRRQQQQQAFKLVFAFSCSIE